MDFVYEDELVRQININAELAAHYTKRAMHARFTTIARTVYSVQTARYCSDMAAIHGKAAVEKRIRMVAIISPTQEWEVAVAEYVGEGHWMDYPPMVFPNYAAALEYANTVEANKQMGQPVKLRSIEPVI